MSKERNKVLHIHSSINDKQPIPSSLELGELGVNNASGNAFISTKSIDGKIVRFSEDGTIVNWMDKKEVFPYEGSVTDVDLNDNTSTISIKLNQVASKTSPHGEDVNNNNGINIDMSRYAMNGANPTFSSVTVDNKATFNGDIEINGSLSTNIDDITNISKGDITNIAKDTLLEKGKDAIFYGTSSTKIGGDGNEISPNITYYRNPSPSLCGIKADTVDGALDEVLNKSKVKYSASTNDNITTHIIYQGENGCENSVSFDVKNTSVTMAEQTYGPDGNLSKTYTLYQDNIKIGTINIPRDHTLKDVDIVNGTWDGTTFTPCEGEGCQAYFKFTWNIYDDGSGYQDDKVVYIPISSFMPEYSFKSTNGVKLNVEKEGSNINVSADTTIQIKNNNGNSTSVFNKANGTHTLNSYSLSIASGDVKSLSISQYDPFVSENVVTVPTDASHIYRNKLVVNYGPVDRNLDGHETYDPGQGTENTDRVSTITIPSSVAHLSRGSLTIRSGKQYGLFTYDGTVNETLYIPTDLSHLDGVNTLTLNEGKFSTASYNPNYETTVNIPTNLSHLDGVNTLTLNEVKFSTASYNPMGATTVNIPTSFEHMNEYNSNNNCYSFAHDICMADNTIAAKGYYASSDRILKENIKTLSEDDFKKVDNVDFKSFNFRDDETKTKTYGVIAQDVQASGLNEIVHKSESGTLNVDYISLLILKIANLENTVKELKKEIGELKK